MRIVVPPTIEPLSLEEARLQCSIDAEGSPPTSIWDPLLMIYITGAREHCEKYLGRAIAPQTAEFYYDAFPADGGNFVLLYEPILAIESITYIDEAGIEMTVDPTTYSLNTDAYPGRVILGIDPILDEPYEWPVARDAASSVVIRTIVGYAAPGTSPSEPSVPAGIKIGMLLLVASMFKNREENTPVELYSLPTGVKYWWNPFLLNRRFA